MNQEQRTFKKVIKRRKRSLGKIKLTRDYTKFWSNKRKGITKKRKILKKK